MNEPEAALVRHIFDLYACLRPEHLRECFAGEYALLSEEEGLYRLQNLWAHWEGMTEKDKHRIGQQIIDKVTVLPNSASVRIRYDALNQLVKDMKPAPVEADVKMPDIANEPAIAVLEDALEISVPVIFKKKGKTCQALNSHGRAFEVFKKTQHDMALVNALGKAHKWEQMIRHKGYTPDKIAKENELAKGYVCSILRLNLLSPHIMEDILCGRQPEGLTLKQLKRPFPYAWEVQKQHFSY